MSLLLGLASAAAQEVRLAPEDSLDAVLAKAAAVRPTPRQIAWQRDEISAFVHFGMNTFTDREWGDGKEDPKLFNPTELDARQWVRAAKAAGITRMILTAKHHDGFCLWPSKFTEHSVKNSPWKGGRGDVVREFVEACRAQGIRYGIYISPWDRHEKSYGDSPRYNEYFLSQLREVLTNYPGFDEVWFDGACAEGPNGKVQEYDWRAYWKLIRELAPNAAIAVRGPDVRWCGNEAGWTRKSEWSVLPMPGDGDPWERSDKTLSGFLRDIYGDDLGGRSVLMRARQERTVLSWYPSQVNTSIRPGWFYHANEDDRVRPLAELLKIYYGSVGGNGQFLLNLPPDRRGLFHENDVARLEELGEVLRRTFARNLLQGATVKAEVDGGETVGNIASLSDEDADTFWTTTDNARGATITVTLPSPVRANCLQLQEHIASGQRVEAFSFEVLSDGAWQEAGSGTVIGHKRLSRFADMSVSAVRIRLSQFRIRPTLAGLGLYFAPAVLSAPKINRDANRAGDANPDGRTVFHAPPAGIDAKRDGIPHGRLETVDYDSKTVGTRRKMLVYLPPGYSADRKYPVLYLLHGLGGTEHEWTGYCRADVILDNLIADKKAVPMVVVMPNGRAQKDDRVPEDIFSAAPSFAVFERDLLDDVIPTIEARYSVQADRRHRGIAGLSMGGGQALNFGLGHPDVFAWVGGFSPAPNTKQPAELVLDRAPTARQSLIWLSCGSKDGLLHVAQRTHEHLKNNQIPHVWHVDDHGHDAEEWKPNFYLFAQRLFAPQP